MAWRSAATSRPICTGASTTTLTCGKVSVSVWRICAWRACRSCCVRQAHRFRPARCASSSSARPQRAGRHAGACTKSRHSAPARLAARARPVRARSNCASSQRERLAASRRCAGGTMATWRPKGPSACSASSATAGSASISGWSSSSAAAAPASRASVPGPSGSACAPPGTASPLISTIGRSGSPVTARCGAPARGCSSGTMRATGRWAASSACRWAVSQGLWHTATQAGPPTRASGSRVKCSSSVSSSNCSSSRPTRMARSRGAPGPTPRGSSTRCQDSCPAGTTATTSTPRPAVGSSAGRALPYAATVWPSVDVA